jgi:anti-sigma factor RsiW
MRQHLDTCDACARRYRTLQQVRAAVRSTAFAPMDAAGFDARVLARVRDDGRPMRFSAPWIAVAAALVIAVSSAVLMLQERTGIAPLGPASVATLPAHPANRPGFTEGRAFGLDCGVTGAPTCVVEQKAPLGLMAGN